MMLFELFFYVLLLVVFYCLLSNSRSNQFVNLFDSIPSCSFGGTIPVLRVQL